MKTRVAVLFGGRSPEHDVSIVTGLQALDALDPDRFEAFPVYIGLDGRWWCGPELRQRETYLPDEAIRQRLIRVMPDLNPDISGRGRLIPVSSSGVSRWLTRRREIGFDVALLAFHGGLGEDGCFQGVFEAARIPYTGMRVVASAVLMHKAMTREMLASSGIPQLPYRIVHRQAAGVAPDRVMLRKLLGDELDYPLIVKPMRLGSSIGVARVEDDEQLRAGLAAIFRLDDQALIEPCIIPLIEYNLAIAARNEGEEIISSAIERPISNMQLLDFRTKYLSGGGNKGSKTSGRISEGMLSLTRELNPDLDKTLEAKLREYARICFQRLDGTGAPRIDFLFNPETGALWLNEVNPIPGSFGYFLWEAAEQPILFTELLSHLIDEAFRLHRAHRIGADPTHPEARLFKRRGTG